MYLHLIEINILLLIYRQIDKCRLSETYHAK